jgi:hypothetical protein
VKEGGRNRKHRELKEATPSSYSHSSICTWKDRKEDSSLFGMVDENAKLSEI